MDEEPVIVEDPEDVEYTARDAQDDEEKSRAEDDSDSPSSAQNVYEEKDDLEPDDPETPTPEDTNTEKKKNTADQDAKEYFEQNHREQKHESNHEQYSPPPFTRRKRKTPYGEGRPSPFASPPRSNRGRGRRRVRGSGSKRGRGRGRSPYFSSPRRPFARDDDDEQEEDGWNPGRPGEEEAEEVPPGMEERDEWNGLRRGGGSSEDSLSMPSVASQAPFPLWKTSNSKMRPFNYFDRMKHIDDTSTDGIRERMRRLIGQADQISPDALVPAVVGMYNKNVRGDGGDSMLPPWEDEEAESSIYFTEMTPAVMKNIYMKTNFKMFYQCMKQAQVMGPNGIPEITTGALKVMKDAAAIHVGLAKLH